ncbi:MAG: hypothetical protein QXS81_04990 [Candidatus Micrarchaeaceae archaeon]
MRIPPIITYLFIPFLIAFCFAVAGIISGYIICATLSISPALLVAGIAIIPLVVIFYFDRYITILIPMLFGIGILAGILLFSVTPTSYTTHTTPSYYEGIVQGMDISHSGYVQFTSGSTLYGNVSRIVNLSLGATCMLLLNQSNSADFINGTCKR